MSLLTCWMPCKPARFHQELDQALNPGHCLFPAAAELWGRRWPGAEHSADSLLEYNCWRRDFKSAVRLYLAADWKHFARCLQLLSCWKPLFCTALCGAWYSLDFLLVSEFYYCPCRIYFKTLPCGGFGFVLVLILFGGGGWLVFEYCTH